jgi:hypothetical protein
MKFVQELSQNVGKSHLVDEYKPPPHMINSITFNK